MNAILILFAALAASPTVEMTDSLAEAVVSVTAAPSNAPFAISRVDSAAIGEFRSDPRELPFLLSKLPGVVAFSDNGVGTGTSYLRIRGSGDSRINVTLDGVTLNSPEDQCVFWANMNGYASFLGAVEVQRGIGSSSNGDGAFGGTVSLMSRDPSDSRALEMSLGYGSFNTLRAAIDAASGSLGHWNLSADASLSRSDGYLHGTSGISGSGTVCAVYRNGALLLRYRNLLNFENTGQAWNGVEYEGTYGDAFRNGLARYNSLCESIGPDGAFIPYPQRTTDRFIQDHNILSAAFSAGGGWRLGATLHYTHGNGFYSQYKPSLDRVRRKGLNQNSYGALLSAIRSSYSSELRMGLSLRAFDGCHYIRYALPEDSLYYESDASKNELSAFVKYSLRLGECWNVFADVQYRHLRYLLGGDESVREFYNFFNPKAGVRFVRGPHSAFFSFAFAGREPERNNFTDNGSYGPPRPERMMDWELGYSLNVRRLALGATLYYMDYRDQFVKTGELSDIGEMLTVNVPLSCRMGVELEGEWKAARFLSMDVRAALSRNRILGEHPSTLAYSPSTVVSGGFRLLLGDFRADWTTSYVSSQYMDNSGSEGSLLPSYSSTDLDFRYAFHPRSLRELSLALRLSNIFDSHHACYGWTDGFSYGWFPSAGFTAHLSVRICL